MRVAGVLFSVSLLVSPSLMAKEGKKHKVTAKECEEKGGQWDKKKKACKDATSAEAAPAPAEGETPPSDEPGK